MSIHIKIDNCIECPYCEDDCTAFAGQPNYECVKSGKRLIDPHNGIDIECPYNKSEEEC